MYEKMLNQRKVGRKIIIMYLLDMLYTAKHVRECIYLCYGFQKHDRINVKIASGTGNGGLPFSQHVR